MQNPIKEKKVKDKTGKDQPKKPNKAQQKGGQKYQEPAKVLFDIDDERPENEVVTIIEDVLTNQKHHLLEADAYLARFKKLEKFLVADLSKANAEKGGAADLS